MPRLRVLGICGKCDNLGLWQPLSDVCNKRFQYGGVAQVAQTHMVEQAYNLATLRLPYPFGCHISCYHR
jgi:hypothetical protein